MYKLINDILLSNHFDNCGCFVFMDAAFTSIKLFRQLHTWGIYAVGPMNVKKPSKGDNGNSWPHQCFKKGDCEYLSRGWDRTVYSKLADGGWIQATVWRDNKFVKLLNTVYYIGDGMHRQCDFEDRLRLHHRFHTTCVEEISETHGSRG